MLYQSFMAHSEVDPARAEALRVTGSIPAEWISGTGLKSLEVLALFNYSLQGAMLLTVNGPAFQDFYTHIFYCHGGAHPAEMRQLPVYSFIAISCWLFQVTRSPGQL